MTALRAMAPPERGSLVGGKFLKSTQKYEG
jgi:hypothetical protein